MVIVQSGRLRSAKGGPDVGGSKAGGAPTVDRARPSLEQVCRADKVKLADYSRCVKLAAEGTVPAGRRRSPLSVADPWALCGSGGGQRVLEGFVAGGSDGFQA